MLPINSDVKVWRENNGWTGPFKLLSISDETCVIEIPRGPIQFRSTVVKPYYHDEEEDLPEEERMHEQENDPVNPRNTRTRSEGREGRLPPLEKDSEITPKEGRTTFKGGSDTPPGHSRLLSREDQEEGKGDSDNQRAELR